MSELRKDPFSNRWVIVARDRGARPQEYHWTCLRSVDHRCPFCVGNESDTPAPVLTLRATELTDGYPWHVRVVPNRYPALSASDSRPEAENGLFNCQTAYGVHEVFIESPVHVASFSHIAPTHAALSVQAYAQRLQAISQSDIRYAILFKNVGPLAGASIEHAHSQLMGMRQLPAAIAERLATVEAAFRRDGTCLYCAVMRNELQEQERLVLESQLFVAFCPYASRFPYEVCILPRAHHSRFENVQAGEARELAGFLSTVIRKLEAALNFPSYNYILHTSPFDTFADDYYHWHVELFPRLTTTAGFEWGTGYFINSVTPEDAAARLREVEGDSRNT